MIIIRQLRLVCLHVHNRQETRKHRIDRLSIQLREVLIATLVRLKESGFDLCGSLVIALKPHPDLKNSRVIGDSLKLRKRKTQNENTMSLAICVVLINLILSVASIKHNVISILTKSPKLSNQSPKDAPIGVVCSIEEWQLAKTVLYVAFMDHGTIKVE